MLPSAPEAKALSVVFAMPAGADSNDDTDRLRASATGAVAGFHLGAGSTAGKWCRALGFGQVHQMLPRNPARPSFGPSTGASCVTPSLRWTDWIALGLRASRVERRQPIGQRPGTHRQALALVALVALLGRREMAETSSARCRSWPAASVGEERRHRARSVLDDAKVQRRGSGTRGQSGGQRRVVKVVKALPVLPRGLHAASGHGHEVPA